MSAMQCNPPRCLSDVAVQYLREELNQATEVRSDQVGSPLVGAPECLCSEGGPAAARA
jgi:hypothetical protein